ncbi:hypothetical protein [Streptomyces canus]|uniref:hypothetical protein n=1 Tax=Streptomyces canus TaxID=58343 RepID=UPI00277D9C34|nr:hypothetical protein [Streptomyces canus]MDQ0767009.1 hypothetical protein [Streptomyces canus]
MDSVSSSSICVVIWMPFGPRLGIDLSAPVEHGGDWTLHDLAKHLGTTASGPSEDG